jgi:uncharacterized protein
MPISSEHQPGTPCWVDLQSPDIAQSVAFYGALFGWEGHDQGPAAGGYSIMTLRGQTVGAIAPKMSPDQPSVWSVYICTADADATTASIQAAGGTVMVEPMDVLDAGRLAIYVDAIGAVFAVWQPKRNRGVELVDEPNTWSWSELLARDLDAAVDFYGAVFEWGVRRDALYNEWQYDGRSIGGLLAMPDMVPAGMPSFWLPYIAVDDVDDTVARATQLGGSVRVPGQDFAGGRFAVINDVHGAGLGLLRLRSEA